MRVRQDKHGKNSNIRMVYLATGEQAKIAAKMFNKANQYVAN